MKVPTYEQHVGLTGETAGVMGSLEQAGAPGKNLEQAGGALTQIAGEVKRRMEHAQKVNDLADFQLAAREQLGSLAKMVKDYDPEAQSEAFKQGSQEWFDNYHQNLKNPEVQAAAKTHWATWYPAALQKVEDKAEQQKILNFAGNLEANWNKSIDLYVQATDDRERAGIKGDAFALLTGGVATLLLHPAKAEQLRQGWDKAVSSGMAEKDIRENPWLAGAKLMDPAKHYPGMDEDTARSKRGGAQSEIARRQQDNAIEVDKMFEAGTLTPQGLQQMRDGKLIRLETYRMYDGALQAGTEAKAVTDMDLYVPLLKNAQAGKMDVEQVYRGLKAGKLKKDDARYLMSIQEREGQPPDDMAFLKDPALKMGFNTALHEIQWRLRPIDQNKFEKRMEEAKRAGGMGKPPRPEAMYENQAAVSFINAVKEAYKKGELTGEWMLKKAVEISKPFEMEGAGGLLRAPAKTGRPATAGQGLGAPVRAPAPSLPKTITKEGKTYRVLTINGKEMVDPTPLPSRAKGGKVEEDQPYIVGEQGPEIFVPDQQGQIISANESKQILNNNKTLNFVDRIMNKDNYPAMENPDGSTSTHLMSFGEYKGKYIVFPTIVWDGGELKKLSGKEAIEYAIKNKEYIAFDDPDKAKSFAAGAYKAPWKE